MSPLQLKIIINACKIRISRGEDMYEVVDSYEKLSADERTYVLDILREETV